MPRTLTVAAAQFEIREVRGFDEFAAQVAALLDRAPEADVVVLPELLTEALFTIEDGWRDHPVAALGRIADHTDAYRTWFRERAVTTGQAILAGSHLVRDGDRLLNTAHLFLPDGTLVTHAKTHIFPAEADWDTGEGDSFTVAEINGVPVGIAVCYEAEIPEVTTILARRGAEVLLVPSYTFTEAGFYRVRHCTAARCIENQVYAVHCPTYAVGGGAIGPGWARASVLSPCDAGFPSDGVLAEAKENVEDVVVATLDLELLAENRLTGAATTHHDRRRRAPLYARHRAELLPAD
jgi:predicted amidohydrolase